MRKIWCYLTDPKKKSIKKECSNHSRLEQNFLQNLFCHLKEEASKAPEERRVTLAGILTIVKKRPKEYVILKAKEHQLHLMDNWARDSSFQQEKRTTTSPLINKLCLPASELHKLKLPKTSFSFLLNFLVCLKIGKRMTTLKIIN